MEEGGERGGGADRGCTTYGGGWDVGLVLGSVRSRARKHTLTHTGQLRQLGGVPHHKQRTCIWLALVHAGAPIIQFHLFLNHVSEKWSPRLHNGEPDRRIPSQLSAHSRW
jgi:hypothetical protein